MNGILSATIESLDVILESILGDSERDFAVTQW
jgi:hypothetical protein